jgi:hypothetical protein
MKKALWMALGLLVASVPLCAQRAQPIGGWLRTEGQQILDEKGHPVRFCGVNVSGMEWGAGKPWSKEGCPNRALGCYSSPPQDEIPRISDWGFNMVRLPVSWSNLEPDPPERRGGKIVRQYNTAYLEALDKIVEQCRRYGLAVVISFHQWGWSPFFHLPKPGADNFIHGCGLPAWLFKDPSADVAGARRDFFSNRDDVWEGVSDAWTLLAERYAKDPTVVGADLFNEPDSTDYARGMVVEKFLLDSFYKKVGTAVRAANPHILLVVEEGRGTRLASAPPFKNVVYSFHEYPHGWDPEVDQWTRERLARAKAWNVPVWIGEFQRIGPQDLPGDPQGFEATRRMLRFFKQEGIGWSYWAYSRAGRPLNGELGRGPTDGALVTLLRQGF